jgi:hypothetical protein
MSVVLSAIFFSLKICHTDPSGLLQVKKTDAGGRLTSAESALVYACNLEVGKVCFSHRHLSFLGCASATLSTVHCDLQSRSSY